MERIVLIATGGMIGALLRYALSGMVHRIGGGVFPWGTLVVNLLGSFLIGVLWAVAERLTLPLYARLFLLVGLLGSFTTFSTYTLESLNLLRDGEVGGAIANILLNNVAGLLLVATGFMGTLYIINLYAER